MRTVINPGADPATVITAIDAHMAEAFGAAALAINSTTAERTVTLRSTLKLTYKYGSTYGLEGVLTLYRANGTTLNTCTMHTAAGNVQSWVWGGLANPGTQPLTLISGPAQVFIGRTIADGSTPNYYLIGKINATTFRQAAGQRTPAATLAASPDTSYAYQQTANSWAGAAAGSRAIFTVGNFQPLLPVQTSLLTNTSVQDQAAGAGAVLTDLALESTPRNLALFATRGTGWSNALATLVPNKPATWVGDATTGYPVEFNTALLADWQAAGLAEGDLLTFDGKSYAATCVPGLIVAVS